MSATRSLTNFYGSFFLGCVDFAIAPYTLTLRAFFDPKKPKTNELILGVAACVFLSTIVPILPELTTLTFALALFAASIAVVSMFIAYPISLFSDALDNCGQGDRFIPV